MSKLEVKSHKGKFKSKPSIVSIKRILDEGRRINYLRCLKEPEVTFPKRVAEKGEFEKNFYVCKILYPSEKKKYPECDHANDIIPNRDMFSHQKYMEFLATPKKSPPPPRMARWIRKNISPATVHVHKLAQPRHRTLIETFKQNCNHFSYFQIETIAQRIYRSQFYTPQQAINEMKQKLHDKQKRVRYQKHEIKKLQKKIEKCNEYNSLAEKLTKMFREFMIKDQCVDECDGYEELTSFALNQLSKLFKSPRGDKCSSNVIDKILLEFSNKFTSIMCDVLQNNEELTEHVTDDCMEKLKRRCLPIHAFYPDIYKKEEEDDDDEDKSGKGSDGSDEESSADDFESAKSINQFEDSHIKDKDDLSFLSMSKIQITPEECAMLHANLGKIKTAISLGDVKSLASAKGAKFKTIDDQDIVRKKKKPKKKKKKRKNEKCFGKRDVKPLWAIEWNKKAEEGVCSNFENKS